MFEVKKFFSGVSRICSIIWKCLILELFNEVVELIRNNKLTFMQLAGVIIGIVLFIFFPSITIKAFCSLVILFFLLCLWLICITEEEKTDKTGYPITVFETIKQSKYPLLSAIGYIFLNLFFIAIYIWIEIWIWSN